MNEMFTSGLLIVYAYIVDLIAGDPRWLSHPVVLIGKCISWLERLLLLVGKGKVTQRLAGCLFPIVIVTGTYIISESILRFSFHITTWVGTVLAIWMLSTTIAVKGLAQAGKQIYDALANGDVELARKRLSFVVGRDTAHLEESEIARAGIETVAENIVDAVTAPLFYAFLGGAPLAFAYKAVNTLDSMVGYKNVKYLHLGWASARLDDAANFLPARITLFFIVAAAFVLRLDWRSTWRIALRDARKHPSPNSGIAEAAVAGALGIRLGGWNQYEGVPSFRSYLGEQKEHIGKEHILLSIRMLYVCTGLYLSVFASLALLL